jgi:type II secretory ATPase GspE/PulE/Tfp pilus assembly ATPase PilB-like protein
MGLQASIVARIKIISKLDITEQRLPQDGHLAVRFGDTVVDVRVSSMPTA